MVLFVVGSLPLALFVFLRRKRWLSSIKHENCIDCLLFLSFYRVAVHGGEITGMHLLIFQLEVEALVQLLFTAVERSPSMSVAYSNTVTSDSSCHATSQRQSQLNQTQLFHLW